MTTTSRLTSSIGKGSSYFLEVVYKYTVAGETYKSQRRVFDGAPPELWELLPGIRQADVAWV